MADLKARFQQAGRARVVISHAVGAAEDGRHALIKAVLFGGASEIHTLPANWVYWLIDRIAQAIAAGAIKDRHSAAEADSPEARQIAAYRAMRPEIAAADWDTAVHRVVSELHAHAFGNALGLQALVGGNEVLLILPDQVAILLHEQLTLAASYLIDRAHPPVSRGEH